MIKNEKGLTLIELLVSIVLLSLLLIVFTSVFVNGIKVYKKESRKAKLHNENRIVLDGILLDIKQASKVNNASTPNMISLETPSIDANEDILYESTGEFKTDNFVYTLNGNQLMKTITPDQASSRTSGNKTLLSDVASLTFTYIPDVNATDQVEVNLITQDSLGGETIIVNDKSKAKLRNR